MPDDGDFLPEDYRFTAELLRRYSREAETDHRTSQTAMFRAVCSNNLNIILSALDKASDEPQFAEAEPGTAEIPMME